MDCCKEDICEVEEMDNTLKRVFTIVLLINLAMFVVELVFGLLAHSNALVADSLDMLADTFVYAISLFVIGKGQSAKTKASMVKGVVMLLLGLYVIFEVIQKIINPVIPGGEIISIIGGLALLANLACFFLLIKYKRHDINVRSAWICSRNDVIANIAVIFAGLLVQYSNSMWPDIIVGLGIAVLVIQSSLGVIKETRNH